MKIKSKSIKKRRLVANRVGSRLGLLPRQANAVAVPTIRRLNLLAHKLVLRATAYSVIISKSVHHHLAVRPHQYLSNRWSAYRRWHEHPHHHKVHYGVLAAYSLVVMVFVLSAYGKVHALSDLTNVWDFSTPGNYNLSSGLETSGSSVRLAANQLSTDANTSALYNFNETSGNTASDASTNANTLTSTTASPWTTSGKANGGASFNGTSTSMSAPDSASLSLTNNQSIESWVKFSSTFNSSSGNDQYLVDKGNYKLYYDHATGKLTYELAGSSNAYLNQAGIANNGSWYSDGQTARQVTSQIVVGSDVYYGVELGSGGNASLWRYNSSTNTTTKVGGNAVNGSFDYDQASIRALALNGTTLYIGTGPGSSAGSSGYTASVYSCDTSSGCTSWTSLGSFASAPNVQGVKNLYYQNGHLYAGLAGGTPNANIYVYNSGTSWTQIGGTGASPSSWTSSSWSGVSALTGDGSGNLYVSLWYVSGANAQVWKCVISGAACSSWTQIGGGVTSGNWSLGSSGYESRLTYVGSTIYALVSGPGTGVEVWRYGGSGTTWTRLGYSGGHPWTTQSASYLAITNDGTNIYVGLLDSGGYIWKCATPASTCTWTDMSLSSGKTSRALARALNYSGSSLYAAGAAVSGGLPTNGFGAKYTSGTWSELANPSPDWWQGGYTTVQSLAKYGGNVYAGINGTGMASVWKQSGSTWSEVGGNGINNSWKLDGGNYSSVRAMTTYNGNLYAALEGTSAGDGEVWMYNGTTWTKVGGDGANSSWNTNYEGVYSLAVYNGNLYAGLGNSAGDGEVWMYNGTSWSQKGGDSVVSGTWASADGITNVDSLVVYNGNLYAGLGATSSAMGKVYSYNGTAWTQLAGTGAATGNWSSAYDVASMAVYNGQLYAGLQVSTGNNAAVWRYSGSGTSWTKVGGDSVNSSWNSSISVASLAVYNGQLYAGTANPLGDTTGGSLWSYNGSTWANVSSGSWSTSYVSSVSALVVNNGQLMSGTGGNSVFLYEDYVYNYDPFVYSYGSNAVLRSTSTSWNTSWHKIGVSYDGTTMKMYVDGTLDTTLAATTTVPDNSLPLLVGNGYGGPSPTADTGGFFSGTIDDLRLSNTARTAFLALDYTNIAQTVTLAAAVRQRGVWHWDDWADSEVANGGTITYRLSIDGGTTWLYWNGSAWVTSSGTSQANDVATVHANINSVSAGFGGITWQAVLLGNGSQQVTLNNVTLSATSDTIAPTTNASSIQAKKTSGSSTFNLASNGWTNGASPYFAWTDGSDAQSGIYGYCLYVGQDNTANPVTTKGMLGSSPVNTGNNCQFLVTSNNVDLGTPGYLATALTTSNTPYYLVIKALDKAGNPIGSTTTFPFKFDNTLPTNPAYITAPSGFVNSKDITFTWPTSGANGAADANSGVSGLQYKINNSSWYGDSHTGTGDLNDLLSNDGSYTTLPTPDYSNFVEGLNTVYFRTWDAAGNTTVGTVNALIKLNTTGAPSEPLNLSATPTTNTTNSFSFNWDQPITFVGDASNITYCYTFNVLPTSTNCTYTTAGTTSLPTGPYATQPGQNTLYVVARDESHNINYANYSSVDFTANTPAPGIPLNVDAVDVSIKATQNWRLALTWDAPTSVGAGVSQYKIYRSLDGVNATLIGTSSSTSYIDAGLTQRDYYYTVIACDSANNCGAPSTIVRNFPTGKFTSPAVLTSQPKVTDITTRKATVSWTTDRTSDSRISIGTSSGNYEPPETLLSDQVTAHQVQLNNLSAGTTYYLVAKWTDEDGNAAHSQELSFTTAPAPVVKEVTTSSLGVSDATIGFTSVGADRVALYYGLTDNFGGTKTLNTSASESDYSLGLSGLNDGTKYYYQLVSFDSEGNAYPGNIFSFTTPPRPRISSLQFQPISGEPTSTQQVTWQTNVPTDSTISYGVVGSDGTELTDPKMTTNHSLIINGLLDNSQYFLIAQSRDINGNLSVSDRQFFRTALDTRPPKISNIDIETSIRGSGAQARGQIIVSWKTDELASSQVTYGTGSTARVLNNKTAEDSAYSTEHIVIISDLPTSEVYSVQPLSKDRSGNQGYGTAQTAIVGRGSDDVITIVLTTLQKVFGF